MSTETQTTDNQPGGNDNAPQPPSLLETAPQEQTQTTAPTEQTETPPPENTNPEEKVGAPEKYEFKPSQEGAEFDPKVISEFEGVARELNLTNEQAQKLLDRMTPTMQAQHQAALSNASNEWANQSRTDSEFGGEKLNENLAVAKKAMDKFGSDEFKSMINESGLGNHPEVIRFLFRIGKNLSEDSVVGGRQTAGQPADARSMYAASNMNP